MGPRHLVGTRPANERAAILSAGPLGQATWKTRSSVQESARQCPARDQGPASACLTSMTASTSMVRPIRPSSTCQARGRANQGASTRAPKPSRPNQAALAVAALGIGWFFGHIDLRRAGGVGLGIIVTFSALWIVDTLTGGGG